MKKLIVITVFVLLSVMANSAVATGKGNPWKKSACPCDFVSTVLWAGWTGPGCFINQGTQSVSIQLHSRATSTTPQVAVIERFDVQNADCWVLSQESNVENIKGFTDREEIEACYRDLNELAIILGRVEGCEVPSP